MNNYHLTHKDEQWRLFKEKQSDSPIGTFKTKDEAMKFAIDYMNKTYTDARFKQDGSAGSLKIHGVDGKIQEERTYPRAADPKGNG